MGGKYICEEICGEKVIELEAAFKQIYKHLRVYDREEQFIDAWVKNITDTNMRLYMKFGLHPSNVCPSGVYNIWEPFAYSLKTGDYTRDEEGLAQILHLVRVLADNEDESEKFLLVLPWRPRVLRPCDMEYVMLHLIFSLPHA